ncbi:MAG: hypothetical protein ACK5KM_05705 [Hyphomicrobiaceae bacterium]
MMPSKLLAFLLTILAIFAIIDISRGASIQFALLFDDTLAYEAENGTLDTLAVASPRDPVNQAVTPPEATSDFLYPDVPGVVRANWQAGSGQ